MGLDRAVAGARRTVLVPRGSVLAQRAPDEQDRQQHRDHGEIADATPREDEREDESDEGRKADEGELEDPKRDEQSAGDRERGGCEQRDQGDEEQDEQDPGSGPRGAGQSIRSPTQNEHPEERGDEENQQSRSDDGELVPGVGEASRDPGRRRSGRRDELPGQEEALEALGRVVEPRQLERTRHEGGPQEERTGEGERGDRQPFEGPNQDDARRLVSVRDVAGPGGQTGRRPRRGTQPGEGRRGRGGHGERREEGGSRDLRRG